MHAHAKIMKLKLVGTAVPGKEPLLHRAGGRACAERAAQGRPAAAAKHQRAKPVQTVASHPPIKERRGEREEEKEQNNTEVKARKEHYRPRSSQSVKRRGRCARQRRVADGGADGQ